MVMKNNKESILIIGLAVMFSVLMPPSISAQNFSYSVRAALTKMDVTMSGHEAVLFPKEYCNGYEIGPLLTYRLKPTPFAFSSGIIYSSMYYSDYSQRYNLNFLNAPLQVSIEAGKKGGVVLGFGCRFWYLLKIPEELEFYDDRTNRFLFSWTGHIGAFFTIKNLRFQLYPQVEYIKTPLYYLYHASAPGYSTKYYHYINIVTYNLSVSF
jgi:hypothetical protein